VSENMLRVAEDSDPGLCPNTEDKVGSPKPGGGLSDAQPSCSFHVAKGETKAQGGRKTVCQLETGPWLSDSSGEGERVGAHAKPCQPCLPSRLAL
jgi:hypothetical protein